MPKITKETDLYPPIRDFLVAQGYTVRSEVNHCDITGVRGEELVVVELKLQVNLALLAQATKRQRLTDSVYVALPRPKRSRAWVETQRLLRRLELGLLLVTLGKRASVEIAFHPVPYQRRKQPRARRAVLREIAARSGDFNQGGSTRRKLVTAYRENVIHVACCLEKFGPLSPKQLRTLGTGPKTYSILYRDVYAWFERVDKALYALRPAGQRELEQYPEPVARCRAVVAEQELPEPAPPDGKAAGAKPGKRARTVRD